MSGLWGKELNQTQENVLYVGLQIYTYIIWTLLWSPNQQKKIRLFHVTVCVSNVQWNFLLLNLLRDIQDKPDLNPHIWFLINHREQMPIWVTAYENGV